MQKTNKYVLATYVKTKTFLFTQNVAICPC